MTCRMSVQLWNTNTQRLFHVTLTRQRTTIVHVMMYISIKFGTGVHVFCWEVGVFNRSSFQSVSCKSSKHFAGKLMYLSLIVLPIRPFAITFAAIYEWLPPG